MISTFYTIGKPKKSEKRVTFKEDEDDETHPSVEQGEDRIEVAHLFVFELDVGGVGKEPDHDKEEVGDGEALALHLQVEKRQLVPICVPQKTVFMQFFRRKLLL